MILDRPEAEKATDLLEVEVEQLRELATAPAEWTAERLRAELKALYLPWNKRLTRDAARALTLPQDAREVLQSFIQECPVRFLRANAQGLLEVVDK